MSKKITFLGNNSDLKSKLCFTFKLKDYLPSKGANKCILILLKLIDYIISNLDYLRLLLKIDEELNIIK